MFGRRLKEARCAKNLSQLTLSRKLSVSQQTIASWEANRTSPPPEMVAQIAVKLEVSADYLLGLSETPNPASPAPDLPEPKADAIADPPLASVGFESLPESEDIKEFVEGYAKLDKKGRHHVMSEFYRQYDRCVGTVETVEIGDIHVDEEAIWKEDLGYLAYLKSKSSAKGEINEQKG